MSRTKGSLLKAEQPKLKIHFTRLQCSSLYYLTLAALCWQLIIT